MLFRNFLFYISLETLLSYSEKYVFMPVHFPAENTLLILFFSFVGLNMFLFSAMKHNNLRKSHNLV